jgi:hypothetical protein
VFGLAAPDIEQARYYVSQGNMVKAYQAQKRAYGKADSSSCPSGMRRRRDGKEGIEGQESFDEFNQNEEGNSSLVECNCPYCDAKVVIDPCASIISCWDCKALVVSGKVRYPGNGGSKARNIEMEKQQTIAGLHVQQRLDAHPERSSKPSQSNETYPSTV